MLTENKKRGRLYGGRNSLSKTEKCGYMCTKKIDEIVFEL